MIRRLLCVFFFVLVYSSVFPFELRSDNEDARLTVREIIIKYGYPCEEHTVTTPDGYILTIHRIPYGRHQENTSSRVVYLQHGLLSSSADWIIPGPEKGLGYILADEGYDVWMGNARGNKLSRRHISLDPDNSDEFWNFSWHEIGYYDVPTMIDYVLNVTEQEDLLHVGHSQGTTTFYVMTTLRPDYNKKIKAHFSLAPVAFMNHMTSPLLHIISFWEKPLIRLFKLIGMREFLPNNEFMAMGGNVLCGDDSVTQVLCTNIIFAICGFSPKEMNASLLPVLIGHTPAGAATKQFIHYAQEINSGYFRQFDYGIMSNLQKYGLLWPPNYDLKKVKVPVYLFYSENDWLAGEIDVNRLYRRLPNCKENFLVPEKTFNHLDFIFGIKAKEMLYNKLISIMANY